MRADGDKFGGGKRPGVFQRFRSELAREELSMATASFSTRELEAAYHDYLAEVDLPRIRAIGLIGVVVWYLFGVLDALTIRENLSQVLTLRMLIAGPVVLAIALLMFSNRMKQYYSLLTGAGVAVFSFSMLAIIHLIGTENAPPYIIGVFAVFIYSSCFTRVSFPFAASIYILTAIAYAMMLQFGGKHSEIDIIAGQFFMLAIVSAAALTHYGQELRSRLIWRRNIQKALDEAYIKELLIEATAADQSKINFLSILSHELRTPLHQIIGFSEIVRGRLADVGAREAEEFVNDIHSSAHELLSRIAKMLRYADAVAGKIQYEKEMTPASDLIETVLVPMREQASARNIVFDVGDLVEADIFIDHHHTSYAVKHLVENAVKASPDGAKISIRGRPLDDGGYLLEIVDEGVGMDEEQLKAAFEPFSQVEQVRTRSRDGLGLGLTLARKIFQDQGADMAIESEKGRGATVRTRFAPPPAQKRARSA